MIIFGTRGVTYSGQKGEFHCPGCGSSLPYKQKRVRRFFTLYFIPVIPLDLLGEYVECQNCKSTFHVDVLEFDPATAGAEFEAEFHRGMKRVMLEMMMADGQVEQEELEVVQKIYQQLAGKQLTDEEIKIEIANMESEGLGIASSLEQMAGQLNDDGKEMVVTAALMVAAADGEFQEEEQELLATIGKSLGMSAAHLKGVMASMAE